jgi:hypothetical protein
MSTPKIAILDIGFLLLAKKLNIINECSINDYGSGITQTYHIKCGAKTLTFVKKEFASQLEYNKFHYHKLPFEFGTIKYSAFVRLLNSELKQYDSILVKGAQKIAILNQIVPNIRGKMHDIGNFECPNVDILIRDNPTLKQTSCIIHNSQFKYCTSYKTKAIETWLQRNYSLMLIHTKVTSARVH